MHLQARLSALSLGIALVFSTSIAFAQPTGPAAEVQRVLASPNFKALGASIDQQHGRIVEERGGPDTSGRAHSLDEWIDVEKKPMVKAIVTSLSIVLAVTGTE